MILDLRFVRAMCVFPYRTPRHDYERLTVKLGKFYLEGHMGRHSFSFPHGDILTTMGATWFVSKAYCVYVDKNHDNWRRPKTAESRSSTFDNCRNLHRYFLEKIETMDNVKLNTNTIGISGYKTKELACEILRRMDANNL